MSSFMREALTSFIHLFYLCSVHFHLPVTVSYSKTVCFRLYMANRLGEEILWLERTVYSHEPEATYISSRTIWEKVEYHEEKRRQKVKIKAPQLGMQRVEQNRKKQISTDPQHTVQRSGKTAIKFYI